MVARGTVPADRDVADDVGVIQQESALGFAVETVQGSLVGGQAVGQNLDGDLASFSFFIAKPHLSHAPFAQKPEKAVFPKDAGVLRSGSHGSSVPVPDRLLGW